MLHTLYVPYKVHIQFYKKLKSPCPPDITCDATTYNIEKKTGDPQQQDKYSTLAMHEVTEILTNKIRDVVMRPQTVRTRYEPPLIPAN